MKYRFVQERDDYSDYASGGVFYGAPRQPGFPVRLANEIFQRCLAIRQAEGKTGPVTLYDPCCGGAAHLSILAFFNWQSIHRIIASDIDAPALDFARRNLALLSLEGLEARLAEISQLYAQFGKPSHAAALESGQALKGRLTARLAMHPIETRLFRADATDPVSIRQALGDQKVDVVLTDIPYGRRSAWTFNPAAPGVPENPVESLLAALLAGLAPGAVVAIAANKPTQVAHPRYKQVGRLKIGKRQIIFLTTMKS